MGFPPLALIEGLHFGSQSHLRLHTVWLVFAMKIIKRLPDLPAERALKILSGRWKTVILHMLLDGPQRTCELEARVSGISQKVLLEQLQALEEHGMVSRQPSAKR